VSTRIWFVTRLWTTISNTPPLTRLAYAVLFPKVFKNLLLLPVEPARQEGDEKD
jgi:hypothetical protein